MEFIGRRRWLTEFQKRKEGISGYLWKITGHSGLGKSYLLEHGFAKQCYEDQHPFITINLDNFYPTSGLEILSEIANCAQFLDTDQANKTFIETAGEWFHTIGQGVTTTTELGKDLIPYGTVIDALAKFGINALSKTATSAANISERAAANHPEMFLLEMFEAVGAQRPVLLIDTYENLLLNNNNIESRLDFNGHRVSPKNSDQYLLRTWLNDLFSHLSKRGWLVIIAGQQIPKISSSHETEAQQLARFSTKELVEAASKHPYFSDYLSDYKTELTTVLTELSFDGNPLWLQLGMNLLQDLLEQGETLEYLSTNPDYIQECFTKGHSPEQDEIFALLNDGSALSSRIEHKKSKLALLDRLSKPLGGLDKTVWKIALPRVFDTGILNVIFPDGNATEIFKRFNKAGVFRQDKERNQVRLHEEIRDLLLTYAKKQNWLDNEEARHLQDKLWLHINKANLAKLPKALQEQLSIENLDTIEPASLEKHDISWMLEATYHRIFSKEIVLGNKSETDLFWIGLSSSIDHSMIEKWQAAHQLHTLTEEQIKQKLKKFSNEKRRLKKFYSSDVISIIRSEERAGNMGIWHSPSYWQRHIESSPSAGKYACMAFMLYDKDMLNETISTCDKLLSLYQNSNNSDTLIYCAEALLYKAEIYTINLNQHEIAIDTYDIAITRFANSTNKKILTLYAMALVGKGCALGNGLDRPREAIHVFDTVINRFATSKELDLQEQYIEAMLEKALILSLDLDEDSAALLLVDSIINQFNGTDLENSEAFARALLMKGDIFESLGNFQKAINSYDIAIAHTASSREDDSLPHNIQAHVNKGIILHEELKQSDKALELYNVVIDRCYNNEEVASGYAKALIHKAKLLETQEDPESSLDAYNTIINNFANSDDDHIQSFYTEAIVNKSNLLLDLESPLAALGHYKSELEQFKDSTNNIVLMLYALAMIGKGELQYELEGPEAALATYDELIQKFVDSKDNLVLSRYADALVRKADILRADFASPEAAILTYDIVIERFRNSEDEDIFTTYFDAMHGKFFTLLEDLNQPIAAIEVCDAMIKLFDNSSDPDTNALYLGTLAIAIESLVVMNDYDKACDYITKLLAHIEYPSEAHCIMAFLKWVARPESEHPKKALQILQELSGSFDSEESISNIESALSRLSSKNKAIASVYIDFFNLHKNKKRLTRELDNILS